MDFDYYYGKHKRKNNLVLPTNVEQKGSSYHFRADKELSNKINALSKELNQGVSKVIKDILNDFFLDREKISWQKEVEEYEG
jgi:predicted DNA-binding protein